MFIDGSSRVGEAEIFSTLKEYEQSEKIKKLEIDKQELINFIADNIEKEKVKKYLKEKGII